MKRIPTNIELVVDYSEFAVWDGGSHADHMSSEGHWGSFGMDVTNPALEGRSISR